MRSRRRWAGEVVKLAPVTPLEVDDSDERLATGSTTGAPWISDNDGGRWDLINARLPPIYAVPFSNKRPH